jgi:hypothetical protein
MRRLPLALASLLVMLGGSLLLHGCEEVVAPRRSESLASLFLLTVTAAGSGSGSVVSNPAGVTCVYAGGTTGTSDCQETLASDVTVVLSTTPRPGSDFVAWDGDCQGTISPCSVTMSQARNVKAFWAKGPYTIVVSGAGNGNGTVASQPAGITCVSTAGATTGSDCQEAYPFSTSVSLTATPAAGHTFGGWGGGCTGTGACVVKANQSIKTVTATFTTTATFPLSVSGQGQGSGTVTSQVGLTPAIACTITAGTAGSTGCAAAYPSRTAVVLTAAPASGSSFSGWSGGCTGLGTCQVTVTQATAVVAGFALSAPSPKATQGEWGPLFTTPVIALHLHLLPTGRVLLWGHVGQPYVWDPSGADPNTAYKQVSTSTEVFCSGHTFLADGSLLVSGGHISNDHGLPDVNLFNPSTEQWTQLAPMHYGRWYPTSVVLGDGQVVTIAGAAQDGSWVGTPERWDGASYTELPGANKTLNYYPRAFLAPNGKIFYAGEDQPSRTLDPTGLGRWTLGPYLKKGPRGYGPAVMYAPGKILYVGGGDPPTSTAEVIDLNVAGPAWRLVGSMSVPRRQLNATLLADGKVLVNGGTSAGGFNTESGAVKSAELWNPVSETWSTMAAETSIRVYHGTALLLPDGRVLSTGSGDAAGSTNEFSGQIFTPPYLFSSDGSLAPRPTITSVEGTTSPVLHYGQTFSVQTPDAANVTKGNLIRLASVTHAFNESQGVYPLTFTSGGPGVLSGTAPPSGAGVPPGPYMLFLLSPSGVPSKANIVILGN